MIELKLSVEQVNQILAILGDLPIKSGLTGLAVEIQQQAQEQLKDESWSILSGFWFSQNGIR